MTLTVTPRVGGFEANDIGPLVERLAQAGKHRADRIRQGYPVLIVFQHSSAPFSRPQGDSGAVQDVDKEGQEVGNG